ncbi:MAG: hypothetical protein HND51_03150 [Chloroflexi bacterium]|nr:hypothetical protein [Chloroflexota bacterium]
MSSFPQEKSPSFIEQGLAAIGTGLGVFAALLLLAILAFQLVFWGRIYPGVSVNGIDLSGVRRDAAVELLAQEVTYPLSGELEFSYEDQAWALPPIQMGMIFDAKGSVEAAYKVGRTGWPWDRWDQRFQAMREGISLSPLFVFDGRLAHQTLDQVATEINQETIEAELSVDGLDVYVAPGQVGKTLDVWTTIGGMGQLLMGMESGEVPLNVQSNPPLILDASQQAENAQRILSQSVTLNVPGVSGIGPWTLESQQLAGMLKVERVENENGATYQIALDSTTVGQILSQIAPSTKLQPKDARYIFNDDTRELEVIEPAIIGQTLDIQASINHINEQLSQGEHNIDLVFDYSLPEITDDVTAAELGIDSLVSSQTTYFYGSSAARIQNIQTAAAQFHGIFVPPGAVFSMVENIGDISLDSGYAESLIIYGDRTIAGVGGGVCQVSTTLFRTVFFGGFPVEERYSHAYRVYYYELNAAGGVNQNMAGLDATVYAPIVDFKFRNDSDAWLLMETYVDPAARTITWKFYGKDEGRSVEWDTTGLENVRDPKEPLYEENDELSRGEVEQVDWAVEGADVIVNRTVYKNGQVHFADEFSTHYEPWRDIYQYGPKTSGCPPEKKKDICEP